jgi:hypothetical protein
VTRAERSARALERKLVVWRALPYRRFGFCCDCSRQPRDERGRPLAIRGLRRSRLRCQACFLARPLDRIPKSLGLA